MLFDGSKKKIVLILVISIIVCLSVHRISSNLYNEIKFNKLYKKAIKYYDNLLKIKNKKNINIPVYYINLERAPGRNEFMLDQMRKLNIKYKRIEGIDGKKKLPKIVYDKENFRPHNTRELGCTMSHIKAINEAYRDGLDYVMICEDDPILRFSNLWTFKTTDIIENAPKDWCIIQIYSTIKAKRNYQLHNLNTSTACYIINRTGMRSFVELYKNNTYYLPKNKKNSDRMEADIYIYGHVNKTYVTQNLLTVSDFLNPSTIEEKFGNRLNQMVKTNDFFDHIEEDIKNFEKCISRGKRRVYV